MAELEPTSPQSGRRGRPDERPKLGKPGRRNGWSAAIRYLLPVGPGRSHSASDDDLRRSVAWFVPIGLLIGLAWMVVFRVSWRVFGQEAATLRALPAVAVMVLECLLTGRYLLGSMPLAVGPRSEFHDPAEPLRGSSPVHFRGLWIITLLILSQWILIAGIPDVYLGWFAESDWRYHFGFWWPKPIFRPLLLAPLWGRWAVLLAATIGRAAPTADPHTAALIEAMNPSRLLRHSLLPLLLTIIFLSRTHNRFIGLILAMIVFAVTFTAAVLMAQWRGGQDRVTVLAAAQTAQLTFLVVYRGFWPFMQ